MAGSRYWGNQDRTVPVRWKAAAPLVLILLLVFGSGCIRIHEPASPVPDSRSPVPDNAGGIYLYQNIVNTSIAGTGNSDAEDSRAVAIHAAMDYRDPVTRDFAVAAIPRSHGGPFSLAQTCDLWETVYSRWTYVDDPHGGDYFSPASRTIALGLKGDCDDFAIVTASLIESVGGSARIVVARNGTAGHAYPEVYVGRTETEYNDAAAFIRQRYPGAEAGCHITTGPYGKRYWLNLDWWSGHPGGRFFADDGTRTAYYPDGHWEQVAS